MDWSHLPSLAALRAFDALARTGSLSAAARQLNVTHAAISQHLRALEAFFGETLATRDGQAMRLTTTGYELANAVNEGFDLIDEGVSSILSRTARRPVTVSLTPSFAEVWLMPRIGQFWAAHPDIEIRLVPTVTLTDMRRDGIDVAIRFGSGDWPGHNVEPLEVSRFVVIASPDYTKAKSLEELGKLNAHDWFFSAASLEQQVWGRAIGIDFNKLGAQDMANNGLVVSAVRAGLGLSLQSRTLVGPDLASGQLVTLYEGDPEGLGYYIVTRPGVLSSGARTFISWLRKSANAVKQA